MKTFTRRAYPKFFEGDSTRSYVEHYFRINTQRSTMLFKSAGSTHTRITSTT